MFGIISTKLDSHSMCCVGSSYTCIIRSIKDKRKVMIKLQGEKQVNRRCMLSELPICKGNNIGEKTWKKSLRVVESKLCFPVGVLRQLNDSRTQLEELWANRKMKLDLCLQLRLFERDALEVVNLWLWLILNFKDLIQNHELVVFDKKKSKKNIPQYLRLHHNAKCDMP